MQSLAERAQARTGLLQEAANAHTEDAAAHKVKLQAEIAGVREIQRVKEVMAHQARKEAADLKKKLEDTEQKAKDATGDLQAVVEGEPPTLPYADSTCFVRSRY
jgi:seryl-tRNA synthetase